MSSGLFLIFFFQAEDGIRDGTVTGVQTCALPIYEWMGMVRQWQELLHGERYSHSYSESLPDFVKMADAFGALGLRAETPGELDDKIIQMIETPRPVLFDCRVERAENCFPMIPSGK